MSKKHKKRRNEVQAPDIEKVFKSSLVGSFSERVGVPMKNTHELMNWIIFGDPKTQFDYPRNDNSF